VEPTQTPAGPTPPKPSGGSSTGVVVGVIVAVLVLLAGCAIGGVVILGRALDQADKQDTAAPRAETPLATGCDYQRTSEPAAKDVGTPPAGKPASVARTATIDSSLGAMEFEFAEGAPCTVQSFAFLAGKRYFDGTSCHRLTTQGILVLQCGDPTGTGTGGPGYQFGTENLPMGAADPYPPGTLAMARTHDPNTNGSQFFIVYGPSQLGPDYTVFGKVTKGLDAIRNAAKAGHDGSLDASAGGGRPKTEVRFKAVTTE
jgi:peptidyl-prolyl cis-trans isomerase B (cyclophilin B)